MTGRAVLALMRNRHLLVLTLLVIGVAGVTSLLALPRTEDPRIVMRAPLVLTFLPGASAERVESLVTEKLEEKLQEVPEIKEIDSTSRAGVSSIAIELRDDIVDTDEVFSEIRDQLAAAVPELPAEASAPDFDDKRGATTFSLIAAITVEQDHELGIATRLAEDLADRLRGVAGTEIVRLYGEPEEELTVSVDAEELAALGLTPESVAAAVRSADVKAPSGVLRGAERDLLLEVRGELDSLVPRAPKIPLRRDGRRHVAAPRRRR